MDTTSLLSPALYNSYLLVNNFFKHKQQQNLFLVENCKLLATKVDSFKLFMKAVAKALSSCSNIFLNFDSKTYVLVCSVFNYEGSQDGTNSTDSLHSSLSNPKALPDMVTSCLWPWEYGSTNKFPFLSDHTISTTSIWVQMCLPFRLQPGFHNTACNAKHISKSLQCRSFFQ